MLTCQWVSQWFKKIGSILLLVLSCTSPVFAMDIPALSNLTNNIEGLIKGNLGVVIFLICLGVIGIIWAIRRKADPYSLVILFCASILVFHGQQLLHFAGIGG